MALADTHTYTHAGTSSWAKLPPWFNLGKDVTFVIGADWQMEVLTAAGDWESDRDRGWNLLRLTDLLGIGRLSGRSTSRLSTRGGAHGARDYSESVLMVGRASST